jgi:lysozyme
MNSLYLDSIRAFEGFTQRAQWDYAQHSNGYGTRALFPGEVIDRAEAERRFQSEIASARAVVERHAANADEGTKAALTSLTFNAGEKWTRDGLGDAVRRGDLEAVRSIFLEYNKAGGKLLEGLAARRAAEAEWIGNPQPNTAVTGVAEQQTAPASAVANLPDAISSWPATQDAAASDQALPRAQLSALSATGMELRERASTSDAGTGLLLMSLKFHMALAAGSQFERSGDKNKDDRHAPPRNGSSIPT